mgnify:CR=1 FL=1
MPLSNYERQKAWKEKHGANRKRLTLTLTLDEYAQLKQVAGERTITDFIRDAVNGDTVTTGNDPIAVQSEIDRLGSDLLNSLPERSRNKAHRNIDKLVAAIQGYYEIRYWDKLTEKMKEERGQIWDKRKELEEREKQVIRRQAGAGAFMTEKQYKEIRGVLHPDKNPDNQAKFNRLTTLWNEIGVKAGWHKR